MKRVFISYRRHDSRYQARVIYAAFADTVSRDNVFMDVDSIPPGANFRKILMGWVDQCEILLALIGPGWIDASDPVTGARRLDNPSDFVRIEIGQALARDIPVVPVLLDGAPLPHVDHLPLDLKELCDRQAEFVEYRTFDADVARLIKKLGLGQEDGKPTGGYEGKASPALPDGRIKVEAAIIHGAPDGWFKPGAGKIEWFKDHEQGPEMVVVPAGEFMMGSKDGEGDSDERPLHKVTIPAPLAVGRFAVTFDEWDAAVAAGGVPHKPGDQGWGRGRRPVINVSWEDAKAYCAWLSKETGKPYRLLSEAEWEYCCRAGTTTPFWWGPDISTAQANYDGDFTYGSGKKGEYRQRTVPVDSFDPNPWGLYQLHGNVWEWCEDAYDSSSRVVRGGSWLSGPDNLRSSYRNWDGPVFRIGILGFRVARVLSPARTL